MIDSVSESQRLTAEEKESTYRAEKGNDEMFVYSAVGSTIKRLLAHPEFDIDLIRQETNDDELEVIDGDLEEGFDGRRRTVGVKGKLPIGTLKIKPNSRSDSGHAPTVTGDASDLRLSQR